MSFSIKSENIQLHLDKSSSTLSLLLEKKGTMARRKSLRNKLAQNPDINSLELKQLLRGKEKKTKTSKSTNKYWAAMLSEVCKSTANCNEQSAA